ncbi:hypothetical protein C4569_02565 [Candidatus Parcubacteria bacterium]|nr:MAG: hypothetical protein C4569_02565 [Candidatus Parcubacteria bacterium]
MKKILIFSAVIIISLALVPMFAAFESHVINVTAKIESALVVSPKEVDFGAIFPQETFYEDYKVELSSAFMSESRVNSVSYVIRQTPKPKDPAKTIGGMSSQEWCRQNHPADDGNPGDPYYENCYPVLCTYLSKIKNPADIDCNDRQLRVPHDIDDVALGYLTKSGSDIRDLWQLELTVPCFEGSCEIDFDPHLYGDPLDPRMLDRVFGCDLLIEVTGIDESPPAPTTTTDIITRTGSGFGKTQFSDQQATWSGRTRYGDNNAATSEPYEVAVGTNLDVLSSRNGIGHSWINGNTEPFQLTFTDSTNKARLTVGGKVSEFTVAECKNSIAITVKAPKDTLGSSVEVKNVRFNGANVGPYNSIKAEGTSSGEDIKYLLLQNVNTSQDWTLTGDLNFLWRSQTYLQLERPAVDFDID